MGNGYFRYSRRWKNKLNVKKSSFSKSDEGLKELQSVLFDYYRNKSKVQTDEFWEKNHLENAKM